MQSEFKIGLKQKFNIKCALDMAVFIIACLLFLFFAKINSVSLYDTVAFLATVIVLNLAVHVLTKQWITRSIKEAVYIQSNSLAEATGELANTISSQKYISENLAGNAKTLSSLIERLKALSEECIQQLKMPKNRLTSQSVFRKKSMIQFLLMQKKCSY